MEKNKNAKPADKKERLTEEHLKNVTGGLSEGYKIDRDSDDASSLQMQEKERAKERAKERNLPKLNRPD